MADLLNSPAATGFFKAFIFWDAKRPVTIDLLKRIDLLRVAHASGKAHYAERFIRGSSMGRAISKESKELNTPFLFDPMFK
jgi:hypothetical protein